MRKLACLLAIIFCFCLTVSAQDQNNGRIDLSIGYSYIHAKPSTANSPSFSLNGGSMAGAWNFGSWAIVGDLGGYHLSSIGSQSLDANVVTFLGGGRLTLHRTERTRVFAQGLVGLADSNSVLFPQTGVTSKTALAFAAGGGVDYYFRRGFGVRGQVDYLATRFQEKVGVASMQNNIRITAGVVLRF